MQECRRLAPLTLQKRLWRFLLVAIAPWLLSLRTAASIPTGKLDSWVGLAARQGISRTCRGTRLSRAAGGQRPTVAQLKEQLRALGLPVSGKRAELLERLGATRQAEKGALGDATALEQLTVSELQSRLKERGLTASGAKAELLQRLRAALETPADVALGGLHKAQPQLAVPGNQAETSVRTDLPTGLTLAQQWNGTVRGYDAAWDALQVELTAGLLGYVLPERWRNVCDLQRLVNGVVKPGEAVKAWGVAGLSLQDAAHSGGKLVPLLAISPLRPEPPAATTLSPGTRLRGRVQAVMSFGLLVEVLAGSGKLWGYVPSSKLPPSRQTRTEASEAESTIPELPPLPLLDDSEEDDAEVEELEELQEEPDPMPRFTPIPSRRSRPRPLLTEVGEEVDVFVVSQNVEEGLLALSMLPQSAVLPPGLAERAGADSC